MFVFNPWIWRSLWLLKKNHKFWVEKMEWGGDAEDDVAAVCDMVQAMDFAVEELHMELTKEED